MSVTKKIAGDYHITTAVDPTANVTVTTHTVFIQGNLFVGGNNTSVSKTDLDITDNTIVLNKGEVGPGVTLEYAGIQVDRGAGQYVPELRWNDPYQRWQITSDGSLFANISTSTSAGGTTIYDDKAPQLGGNLDVLGQTIFSSNTQQVKIDSNLALQVDAVTPTAIANYNTIYAAPVGGGGSGVYQTSYTNSDELASRNRALIFALVL